MSSSQLLFEILALSSSLDNFGSQFQLLNVAQSSSLFSFAPELLSFVSDCGNSFNSLSNIISSPVLNSLLLNLNSNSNNGNSCLVQLVALEQLFLSGNSNLDLNNNNNNNNNNNDNNNNGENSVDNSTDVSNSTASVDVSNSTAAANESANANVEGGGNSQPQKEDKKKGKGEKRSMPVSLVEKSVKRSAAGKTKKQVLGSVGLFAMVVVGAFVM